MQVNDRRLPPPPLLSRLLGKRSFCSGEFPGRHVTRAADRLTRPCKIRSSLFTIFMTSCH
jgi:hypothetical protein